MKYLLLLFFSVIFMKGAWAQEISAYTLRNDLVDLMDGQMASPESIPVRDWRMAVLYDALYRLSEVSGEHRYLGNLAHFGEIAGWSPGSEQDGNTAFAVASSWLKIYRANPEKGYRMALSEERLQRLEIPRTMESGSLYFLLPALASLAASTDDTAYLDKIQELIDRSEPETRNALDYLGMALAMEALPESPKPLVDNYLRWTRELVASQGSDGLWSDGVVIQGKDFFNPLSESSLIVTGLVIGIEKGILEFGTYWPLIEKTHRRAYQLRPDVGRYHCWEMGAVIGAGAAILGLLDDSPPVPKAGDLLEEAERRLEGDQWPRAHAQYIPRRKDDIAWENDLTAYRIYGPALRESAEGSGIDLWLKRVTYPIIEKWYRLDFAGINSYHNDLGEGYDGYKVGPRRGCGGAGLWEDGQLFASNVYEDFAIFWTPRGEAHFKVWYTYPDGIREEKTFRIRLGSLFTEVSSAFSRDGQPVNGLQVAVGLSAQTKEWSSRYDLDQGEMDMYDYLDTEPLLTMVRWDQVKHPEAKEAQLGSGAKGEALVILKTNSFGELNYRFGYKLVEKKNTGS